MEVDDAIGAAGISRSKFPQVFAQVVDVWRLKRDPFNFEAIHQAEDGGPSGWLERLDPLFHWLGAGV